MAGVQGEFGLLVSDQPGSIQPGAVADPARFRSRLLQASHAASLGFVEAIVVLAAAFAASGPLSLVILGLGILVLVLTAYRSFRIELIVDERGVIITNFLRSHALRWEEVGDVWIGLESVGFALMPTVAFARRGETKPISSQATALSNRYRSRVLETIRPYTERWQIRVHD